MRRLIRSLLVVGVLSVALAVPAVAAPPTVLLSMRCVDKTDPSGQVLNGGALGSMREVRAFLNDVRKNICVWPDHDFFSYEIVRISR